uniref:Uncharacterized protein n=1 Tax=Anguilla anguilla TaxID=7936 RepID=A0A0E9SV32_ANGAN
MFIFHFESNLPECRVKTTKISVTVQILTDCTVYIFFISFSVELGQRLKLTARLFAQMC